MKSKDKRGKGIVGAGDKGRKIKTDSDASGGNSVIEALTTGYGPESEREILCYTD